jgi:hypothetical protein
VVEQPVHRFWPCISYLEYDNASGALEAGILRTQGHYDMIQSSNPAALDAVYSAGMRSVGALYAQDEVMLDWFNTGGNGRSEKIAMWINEDEPDSGPGPLGPVKSLRDVYDVYYDRKAKTNWPMALNIMHAFPMEEYAEGCDLVLTDPFVKDTTDNNVKRIREWAGAAKRAATGPYTTKKVGVVLWQWAPTEQYPLPTAIDPALYASEFDGLFLEGDHEYSVDMIAGFNFSGTYSGQPRRVLSVDVPDLWQVVCTKNEERRHLYALPAGWSMISIPIVTDDEPLTSIFPEALSAFEWDNGYAPVTTLSSGKGYWLNMGAAADNLVHGDPELSCALTAPAGWSFLPCPYITVHKDDIGISPPSAQIISLFEYDNGYKAVDRLKPGKGYWLNMSEEADLTIPSS